MKALKLVLAGIAMLLVVLLLATKIFTTDQRKLRPVTRMRQPDSIEQDKKDALMAFPLYTPVSMPF